MVKLTSASLPGGEGFGVFPAVAELAAHGLAAKQFLIAAHIAAHLDRRGVEEALAVVALDRIGIVVGVDVDELHVEVGICACRGYF
jgi:hypothetical protein